ncbi:MAG: hypothetical protein QG671_4503, partial [Actinomycetota bacterium]|nr:hypothetical protein [Actinomycetota bacterium]
MASPQRPIGAIDAAIPFVRLHDAVCGETDRTYFPESALSSG